jgi:hypothetical protein
MVDMRADLLYCVGTVFQLIAFAGGMRPTTLGLALAVYGIGVFFYARTWT